MLNLNRKENDVYVFEEIVILGDANGFLRYEKVEHHVNQSSLEIDSFVNHKKVLNNRLPNEFSSSSFIEKTKTFIKSSELGKKAVKAALALAISTGLSVSANAIENQNLNTHQIEHNVAKEYLIKNVSPTLIEGLKKAKEFNQETGIEDHENKETLDFENHIRSYVRVIDIDVPVIAEYTTKGNEINVYISQKALNEINSIEQAKEMIKMVRNMSLHEYQHALTFGQGKAFLEKYAVEAQQKFGEEINTEILPKSVIERNKNFFKEAFNTQMDLLKNEIQSLNINTDKKEEFSKMINSFETSYQSKLKTLNTFELLGKREVTLDTSLPNEYLSTTMGDKDFKALTKELNLTEREQFVLSRQSALITHIMPTELAKQGYELQDIKELTSLAIESQENYKENTSILEDEKSFFHTALTDEFKDTSSAYYKWLNKEMEKAQIKEYTFAEIFDKLDRAGNLKDNINFGKDLLDDKKFVTQKEAASSILDSIKSGHISISKDEIKAMPANEIKALKVMTDNNIAINSTKSVKEFVDVLKSVTKMSIDQGLNTEQMIKTTIEKLSEKNPTKIKNKTKEAEVER
jgi:hypothetical protein